MSNIFQNLYQINLVAVYCFKLKSSVHDGGCTEFVVQTETHAKVSRSLAANSINVITVITCAFESETYFEKKYTEIKSIVTCKVCRQ